jgi:O-antigen ligase
LRAIARRISAASIIAPGVRERLPEARSRVLTSDAAAIALFLAFFGAVAVATARRPLCCIAVLIAVLPFGYARYVGPTTLTLPKLALLASFVGLVASRRSFAVLGGGAAKTFIICGALVVAATVLSILDALYRGPVLRESFKMLEYLLTFVAVYVAWRADPGERPLRIALAAVAALVGVLALSQEITGAPSDILVLNYPVPRAAGPLEGPNQLAGYLGIMLALVTAFVCTRGPTGWEIASLGLGAAALMLTLSRAGVLASLGGIALVIVLSPGLSNRRALGALAAGVLTGVAGLVAWGYAAAHTAGLLLLIERFASAAEAEDPGRVGTRTQLWHAAWTLWKRHPLFGIGAGNFELELPLAGLPKLHTHANSLYLQSLVEGGIPLFGSTIALVSASIVRFARGPFRSPLVLGALGASVGLAVHQVVDLLVFYPKVGEMWWIALALGAAQLDAPRA